VKKIRLAALVASLFAVPVLPTFAAPAGLEVAGMDTAVRAQDDLFAAMNGKWLATTEIPADKSAFGMFHQLDDLSNQRVKLIVEALSARKPTAGAEQKVATYYSSYMDTKAIDKRGDLPARQWLKRIDGIRNSKELSQRLGELQGLVMTPIYLAVGPDDKDTTTNVPLTWQAGIGLPDRDYFLQDNPKFAQARDAYLAYLETLLKLSGRADASAAAKAVFELERKLAEVQWDKVENRDPVKTYNAMSDKELITLAPGLDWPAFFEGAGLTWSNKIVISQPSFVTAAAKLAGDVPLTTWKAYLQVRVLDGMADVLPQAYRDASFEFHGKAIQGLKQEKPRWELGAKSLSAALGEAVGQVYVGKYFPPEHKARMRALVGNLMVAYRHSIDGAAWMTAETKKKAQEKLATYTTKIGYPDKWRDYSKLAIKEGDAFGNNLRAGRFEFDRKTRRAGQKVDRSEWGMNPQTVNAYYNPNFNEIVFPAAILQPPFFDMAADDAINYGAIGAVIGHEISHGFDDQGSQFDGQGNLNNWWSEADRKAFDALGARLVAQYEAYEPLPGQRINGKLTLGENIADLSGLQIAYKAYQLSLGGKPSPVIDGLTGEQRLFLSWSQAWRTKVREQRALQLLTMDPHSPPQFRANGAAVNADGFHAAFATKDGDKMFRPDSERIRIW
jgi:putative endopeptidase